MKRVASLAAAVLSLALPGAEVPPNTSSITCTPTSVRLPNGKEVQSENPIALALQHARDGTQILLQFGDYPGFSIGAKSTNKDNARTRGGKPGWPIVVEGMGYVRILNRGLGDTISVDQSLRNGYITFRNLELQPGYRSAVIFNKLGGKGVHAGFVFENVDIKGEWDHAMDTGQKSKWGVWGHSLRDFAYRGVGRPAVIEDLKDEHAFYLQNPRGNVTIENVAARRLGRTFCQFTARSQDGPPGVGHILVRNCEVEDVAIARGDNFKGGAAFTLAGRHNGTVLFEGNTYRAGFDASLKKLTRGAPYGTGAFVAWDGGERHLTANLVLRDNVFELAEGCGDRPLVAIGACKSLRIVGRNRFVSGGQQPALALDPTFGPGDDRLISAPNGRVVIAETTEIEGGVTVCGKPVKAEALEKLRPRPRDD